MKDNKNGRKRFSKLPYIIAVVFVCTAVALAASLPNTAKAIFNEADATHISDDSSIEEQSLIIGTHIIHLSALTDQLYDIAKETASASDQSGMYYKSELAGGAWFNISSASDIHNIQLGASNQVTFNDVISKLWVRYKTGSDKITIDLMTNEAVNPFDSDNHYELYERKEVLELRTNYENLKNKDSKTTSENMSYALMNVFWRDNLHNAKTDQLDDDMDSLQKYYKILAAADDDANRLACVQRCQESVNAEREVEIVNIFSDELDYLSYCLSGSLLPNWYYICQPVPTWWPDYFDDLWDSLPVVENEEEDTEQTIYESNTDLIGAASGSQSAVSDSIIENEGKMIMKGTTVLSEERYNQYQLLILNSKQDDTVRNCDAAVDHLIWLDNIENQTVIDLEEELDYLLKTLYPRSMQRYQTKLYATENSDYISAKMTASISVAVLKKMLKSQMSEANMEAAELESLITAITDRMESEDALAYVDERLEECQQEMKDSIKWNIVDGQVTNDYASYAEESRAEYEQWLKQLRNKILADMGGSDLDSALATKEKALNDLLDALESVPVDQSAAKKAQAIIDACDDYIESIGGDTTAVDEELEAALDALGDGDLEALETAIEALDDLSSLMPNTVENALNKLKEAIENALGIVGDGSGDGSSGDGSGGNGSGGNGTGGDGSGGNGSGGNGSGGNGSGGDGTGGNGSGGNGSGGDGTGGDGTGGDGSSGDGSGGNGSSGDGSGAGGDGNGEDLEAKTLEDLLGDVNDIIAECEMTSSGKLSTDEIMDYLKEKYLGDLLGNLLDMTDPNAQGAILIALDKLGTHLGDEKILALNRSLAMKFYNGDPANGVKPNPFVFYRIKGVNDYLNAKVLAGCIDFRYVYDNKEQKVTLSHRGTKYEFKVYSGEMIIGDDGESEEMTRPTQFKQTVHIPSDFSYDRFGWLSYPLKKNDFAVAADDAMLEESDDLFEEFLRLLNK